MILNVRSLIWPWWGQHLCLEKFEGKTEYFWRKIRQTWMNGARGCNFAPQPTPAQSRWLLLNFPLRSTFSATKNGLHREEVPEPNGHFLSLPLSLPVRNLHCRWHPTHFTLIYYLRTIRVKSGHSCLCIKLTSRGMEISIYPKWSKIRAGDGY